MKTNIMKFTTIVVNCFFQTFKRKVPFRDPIIQLSVLFSCGIMTYMYIIDELEVQHASPETTLKYKAKTINFSWLGPELSFVAWSIWNSTNDIFLQISSGVVWQTRNLHLSHNTLYLLSPRLCFFIVLKRDLFVYRDDSSTS